MTETRESMVRARRARVAAVVALALVVAASAWLLARPGVAASRIPSEEAQREAATRVLADYRPGDVIRVHPWWFVGPRRLLFEGLPDMAFPWYPLDLRGHPDALHLMRYERVWVLSAYGALEDDDEARLGLPLKSVGQWEWPGLRLSLHALPQSPIRYDLLRRLGDATVRRGTRRCRWDAKALRHRCGEQPWKDVFVAVKEVGDATRQVVYAEPHPANTELVITYPRVPLDGPLVFRSGFSIEGARRTSGADTRVRVLVDGALVAERVEPKNDFTWTTTVVPAQPGEHEVAVIVDAPDVGWRQFCFDGAVVTAEGATLLDLP